MNAAEKVLRKAAADAIKAGNDDEHARAVAALDAWLGRGSVTDDTATSMEGTADDRRTYERNKKRRQRDKSRDNVPEVVPTDVPGLVPESVPDMSPGTCPGTMSPWEGGKGGGILRISRNSLGSESDLQIEREPQNEESSFSLTPVSDQKPARARRGRLPQCLCPLDLCVSPDLEEKCFTEKLPNPHRELPQFIDYWRHSGRLGADWPAALRNRMRALPRTAHPPRSWQDEGGPEFRAFMERTGRWKAQAATPPPEPEETVSAEEHADLVAQLTRSVQDQHEDDQ